MLTLLKIRHLALVDALVWEPQRGFLAITGETGAGKSVIMGGIALVLGERADKGMIRSGETQCSLEAGFSLSHPEATDALLEEAGVPPCEEGQLIIRRVITTTGNRQFINNSPVTLQLLRRVGAGLVDMHHPESHRSLTSTERQLFLLDAFAEDGALLDDYRESYRAWVAACAAHRELREREMANERELDFLRHQVREIEEAAFTAEEVAGLEERWQRARNAGRLRDTVTPMLQLLAGEEDSLPAQLRRLVRLGHELTRLDAAAQPLVAPLEALVEELEDSADALQDYADSLGGDPAELSALEQRVATLDSLKRKYGADWESICAHAEACRARLEAEESRDERLHELAEAERAALERLRRAGEALAAARRKAAPRLERDFLMHAAQLGFRRSLFRVQFTPEPKPAPQGTESVDFLFGPNPGEPLKPLRLIASSGELARVMLALKSALAKQDDTPLLVFDEIDANVGGEIARAVGMKMRELGTEHQVISITHFPQVAALADHHYLIAKGVEQGRTLSRLSEVRGETRVQELVRMLGTQGETAEAHARSLLLRPDGV